MKLGYDRQASQEQPFETKVRQAHPQTLEAVPPRAALLADHRDLHQISGLLKLA